MTGGHAISLQAPLEIGLCVADLDRSLGFYRDILGFELVSRIGTPVDAAIAAGFADSAYTVVRLALPTGERIKLFAPHRPMADGKRPRRPLDQVGFAYLTLIVEDIAAACAYIADQGHPPRAPAPYPLRPDVLVGLVEDPDGNLIELVQYLDIGKYLADRNVP